MKEKIEFLSAVILVSENAERLSNFYKNVVGLPLQDEVHGETNKHYGCELGDLHFAIHPTSNFEGTGSATGSVKLAFNVFNIESFVQKMKDNNVKLAYEPKNTGFAIMTAIIDPDGNYVEFTQLSDRWFKHLQNRKKEGFDVVTRWQESKTQQSIS